MPINIPLSIYSKDSIKPTREGIDFDDDKTPFVESNIENLIEFYSSYKGCKEYKFSQCPYVDTIPLKSGDKGFNYGTDVNNYVIEIVDARFKIADQLQEHGDLAIDLFKKTNKIKKEEGTDKWENNLSMRITQWDNDSNLIKVQPAYYFDQVCTNLTLDWASGKIKNNSTATIRNNVEPPVNGSLPKLKDSILANTLGIAVFFISKNHKDILIPIRGEEQAIMTKGGGQFHCSSSGVFEWPKKHLSAQKTNFDIFTEGMRKEINDELNLTTS